MWKPLLSTTLLVLVITVGCTSPSVDTKKEISLEDYWEVLEVSRALPSKFVRLNPADEMMSNKDLELGKDFSETALYLLESPYQVIIGVYSIGAGKTMQAANDAFIKDETQIRNVVNYNAKKYLAQEGLGLISLDVEISYPPVGDLAVLGIGSINVSGMTMGYDLIMFKLGKVYVNLEYVYLGDRETSLVPVAEEVLRNLGEYKCN